MRSGSHHPEAKHILDTDLPFVLSATLLVPSSAALLGSAVLSSRRFVGGGDTLLSAVDSPLLRAAGILVVRADPNA